MNFLRAILRDPILWLALALGVVWLLTGCATQQEPPAPIRVHVAVPVECREPVPDKPVLPVDSLAADVPLDVAVRAMIASIERLMGYSGQLEAALDNCRRPVGQGGYGLSGEL